MAERSRGGSGTGAWATRCTGHGRWGTAAHSGMPRTPPSTRASCGRSTRASSCSGWACPGTRRGGPRPSSGPRDSPRTRRRRSNGREEPWRVRYWGVGNEVYGPWQMGHRSAQRYAEDAAEHARFMRAVDPSIQLIGVGIPWDQERWTTPVLATAGRFLDHLSLHHYGASNHLMTGDDYENVVAQSLYFEREISRYSQLVA